MPTEDKSVLVSSQEGLDRREMIRSLRTAEIFRLALAPAAAVLPVGYRKLDQAADILPEAALATFMHSTRVIVTETRGDDSRRCPACN